MSEDNDDDSTYNPVTDAGVNSDNDAEVNPSSII
jgi:hypothetical protein